MNAKTKLVLYIIRELKQRCLHQMVHRRGCWEDDNNLVSHEPSIFLAAAKKEAAALKIPKIPLSGLCKFIAISIKITPLISKILAFIEKTNKEPILIQRWCLIRMQVHPPMFSRYHLFPGKTPPCSAPASFLLNPRPLPTFSSP